MIYSDVDKSFQAYQIPGGFLAGENLYAHEKWTRRLNILLRIMMMTIVGGEFLQWHPLVEKVNCWPKWPTHGGIPNCYMSGTKYCGPL